MVAKDNKLNSEAYINPTQARWVAACSKMLWLQLLPATSSCCFQLRIIPKISMNAGNFRILWRDSPGFIRCSVNLKRFDSERAIKTRRLPTWTTAYVRGRLTSKISRCMGKSGMRWEYNSNSVIAKNWKNMGKHIFPHTVINMGKLCSNLFTFFLEIAGSIQERAESGISSSFRRASSSHGSAAACRQSWEF